ncbi:hypothetical protein NPIL_2411 [Nephila pilipes]|uniref:Uncharacterized protein n=1 Tax=Nephila pilipes TaxID=299642 RepID=A0A8X6NMJ9_NEPPI|nr:hypothetical protein NPIL_2411 [Nephila pilipes]
MCPAIHTNYRSKLRSSSTREPSDPLLRVVIVISFRVRIGGVRDLVQWGAVRSVVQLSHLARAPGGAQTPLGLEGPGSAYSTRLGNLEKFGKKNNRATRTRRRLRSTTTSAHGGGVDPETSSHHERDSFLGGYDPLRQRIRRKRRRLDGTQNATRRYSGQPACESHSAPEAPERTADTSHARTRCQVARHARPSPRTDLAPRPPSAGPGHHRRTRHARPQAPSPLIRSIKLWASISVITRASSLLGSSSLPRRLFLFFFELSRQSPSGVGGIVQRDPYLESATAHPAGKTKERHGPLRHRTGSASDDPLPPHEITNASPIRSPISIPFSLSERQTRTRSLNIGRRRPPLREKNSRVSEPRGPEGPTPSRVFKHFFHQPVWGTAAPQFP